MVTCQLSIIGGDMNDLSFITRAACLHRAAWQTALRKADNLFMGLKERRRNNLNKCRARVALLQCREATFASVPSNLINRHS